MRLKKGDNINNNYEIIHLIGTGSMGQVYLARSLHTQKEVAIKILTSQNCTTLLKRFDQEAHILASLRHENIVSILDSGHLPDTTPFIVMEYIHGESLETYLAIHHNLSWQHCVDLMLPVARGLRALHAKGFVHRDLKPDNILITSNEPQQVKLVDFGVARNTNKNASLAITRAGTLIGTPAYMSPEQLFGDEASCRSDVYAFGVIFYELLTGQLPHSADSIQMLRQLVLKQVAPPKIPSGYPKPPKQLVDLIIQKTLIFTSSDRITAEELVHELLVLKSYAYDTPHDLSLFETLSDLPSEGSITQSFDRDSLLATTTEHISKADERLYKEYLNKSQ